MLKRLRLCPKHSGRVKRHRDLLFEPGINLLIGPNGTGKSTILRAIAGCPDCQRLEDGPTRYALHDTESMNPRLPSGPAGNRTNMVLRARAMFSSHGQSLQDAFAALRITPYTCLLVDEPESGQDLEHVLAFGAAMTRAAARGVQVLCATHQILFWDQAHFIELRRDYRQRILDVVSQRIHSTQPVLNVGDGIPAQAGSSLRQTGPPHDTAPKVGRPRVAHGPSFDRERAASDARRSEAS